MATLVKTELLTDINSLWKKLTNRNITTEEFDVLYDGDISDLLWLRNNLKDRLELLQTLEELQEVLKSIIPKDDSCK
jgi:hypothetical protein